MDKKRRPRRRFAVFGIEMGQHCMITQVQANLIYDDGAPYCDKIPNGITGWIKTCHRNKE